MRHRIEAFLGRIQPLYPLVKGKGPQRHAALKRLQRLCEREVNLLRSEHTLATVKLYLSSYRSALRAIDPEHPALRARKTPLQPALQLPGAYPRRKPGPSTPLTRPRFTRINPISSP